MKPKFQNIILLVFTFSLVGLTNPHNVFAAKCNKTLSGYTFVDSNANSFYEIEDEAISGIEIRISNDDVRKADIFVESSPLGKWQAKVCPGTYTVTVNTSKLEPNQKLISQNRIRTTITDKANSSQILFFFDGEMNKTEQITPVIQTTPPTETRDPFILALILIGIFLLMFMLYFLYKGKVAHIYQQLEDGEIEEEDLDEDDSRPLFDRFAESLSKIIWAIKLRPMKTHIKPRRVREDKIKEIVEEVLEEQNQELDQKLEQIKSAQNYSKPHNPSSDPHIPTESKLNNQKKRAEIEDSGTDYDEPELIDAEEIFAEVE